MEWLAVRLLGAYVAPSLHVAVFFVANDLATGVVLLLAVHRRLRLDRDAGATSRSEPSAPVPAVSVLIAAYNEASEGADRGIVATVRGVAAQLGVTVEILVGDDGSRTGRIVM